MSKRGGTLLQRFRVPLGFLFAAVFLIFARPQFWTLVIGGIIAFAGILIRAWLSGHIRKNLELAVSGPYCLHAQSALSRKFYARCRLYDCGGCVVARADFYCLIPRHLFAGDARRIAGTDHDFRRKVSRIRTESSALFSASDSRKKV